MSQGLADKNSDGEYQFKKLSSTPMKSVQILLLQ